MEWELWKAAQILSFVLLLSLKICQEFVLLPFFFFAYFNRKFSRTPTLPRCLKQDGTPQDSERPSSQKECNEIPCCDSADKENPLTTNAILGTSHEPSSALQPGFVFVFSSFFSSFCVQCFFLSLFLPPKRD